MNKAIFADKNDTILYNSNQFINKNNLYNTVWLGIQKHSKIGLLNFGGTIVASAFQFKAKEPHIKLFSQPKTTYNSFKKDVYFEHIIDVFNISIRNKVALGELRFTNKKHHFINYSANLSYNPNNFFNISGSYENRIASYPLHKLTKANTIVSFNTIETPSSLLLKPTYENVISFEFSKNFKEINFDTDFGFIYGKTYNQNSMSFNSPFIFSRRDQLQSNYKALSLILTKSLKKAPLTIILEPEALFNSVENSINDTPYKNDIDRWFLGLKLKSFFNKKKINVYLYPKYSKFDFKNNYKSTTSQQEFLSFSLLSDYVLLDKTLFFDFSLRKVYFINQQSDDFLNINAKLSGRVKNLHWFCTLSNIANNQFVILKDIMPVSLNIQQHNLFERYIKFGLEYKF